MLTFAPQVIHDPDQRLLVMVMEYLPGGSVLSTSDRGVIEPLPEATARRYFR